MKCGIIAACIGLAVTPVFADGDDDLGLPQLDAPVPDLAPPAGYFVHEDTVYALIGERAVPLEGEAVLRITPRNIIGFDGRPTRLPAGQMLMTDGSLQPLPVAPRTPPPPPAAPAPAVTPIALTPSAPASAPAAATSTVQTYTANSTSASAAVPYIPGAVPAVSQPLPAPVSSATVPPPVPPERTGPLFDHERPIDRTRPESVGIRNDDPTRLRDEQRPPDRSRPGTDDERPRDRTLPGPDDYRYRDRTMQGPDDQRPPDRTRQPPRR